MQTITNETHIMYDASIKELQPGLILRKASYVEFDLECSFDKTVDVDLNDFFVPLQSRTHVELADSNGNLLTFYIVIH